MHSRSADPAPQRSPLRDSFCFQRLVEEYHHLNLLEDLQENLLAGSFHWDALEDSGHYKKVIVFVTKIMKNDAQIQVITSRRFPLKRIFDFEKPNYPSKRL